MPDIVKCESTISSSSVPSLTCAAGDFVELKVFSIFLFMLCRDCRKLSTAVDCTRTAAVDSVEGEGLLTVP